MVLKAMKKICQNKTFLSKKKNSMKKTKFGQKNFSQKFSKVQKFSEVPKFGYFLKVVWKTMFFTFRTHLIHWPFASNAMPCTIQTTVAKFPNTTVVIVTITSALDCPVSRTVGSCLYGTLLLRPRWTACPVQIRAHHHIDVYTNIS